MKRALVSVLSVIILGGCTTISKQACEQMDWYELGRQVGSAGKPLTTPSNKRHSICLKDENNYVLYKAGYNAGIAQYCAEENAYILGKTDQPYTGNCPPEVAGIFIQAYNDGKKSTTLENQKREAEVELLSLNEMLLKNRKNSDKIESIMSEIKKFEKIRAQNESELNKLDRRRL